MHGVNLQTVIDFNARFGNPRIQRYRLDERLRLSVEYKAGGRISAIEIAPAGYRGFNPSQPPEMLSETADRILEKLLPGITLAGLMRETAIKSAYPGFSRQIRGLPGASLIRDYPLGNDRSKMIAAGLELSGADLSGTASDVISPLGAPEYERFAAGSGLAVGVFQGSQGSSRQIVLSAEESLLAHHDHATPIRPDAAEMLLIELLPASARTGEPRRSLFCSGAYRQEGFHFPQFMVSRNYGNAGLIGISIVWRGSQYHQYADL